MAMPHWRMQSSERLGVWVAMQKTLHDLAHELCCENL